MTRILVFGTFDLLHDGHKDFFRQAKKLGDELFVVIALDATVEEVKGRPPDWNEIERKKKVGEVEEVDEVVLGNFGDKYQVIKEIKPDIIALGYDQKTFTHDLEEFIQENNLKIKIVKLKPFHPEKYKTSKLRD